MKREEIKTLEDAMIYISEIEEKHKNHSVYIEALNTKVKSLEESNKTLSTENTSIKEKYFDLWLKESKTATIEEDKKVEEEPPTKSLEELLMED